MEGYISEIRIFAGNFAPRGWAFCAGQQYQINQYTPLYALIGTYYGGDGQQSFNLPDFRGRTAIGTGQGNGLSYYEIGETGGTPDVSLLSTQLPVHTHGATVTPGTGAYSGTANLMCVDTPGNATTPLNGYIGQDGGGNTAYFASASGATLTAMASGSVAFVSPGGATLPSVTLGPAGGSTPHNNMMPSLAVNYIICVEGIFPSRN